jgi:monofunctional biosynthetic peptidoglycan transglycosylase
MDETKWISEVKSLALIGSMILVIASLAGLVGIAIIALIMTLPDVQQLRKCFTTSMFQVHLCPESENYVKLSDISPYVIHAVIASEDGAFYSHQGFDWHEMEESLNQNLRTGQIRRGGSTLTQQLAKNAFLGQEKSFWRKLKEAYLAHAIERHFTKDFILEKYLNVVEFGKNLYGVKAAANKYFHKGPGELNPLESAYLAFLLPNPKVYSKSIQSGQLTPFTRKMLVIILRRMASYGKISAEAYKLSMQQMPNFPWSGLDLAAFQGTPSSYSLDATPPTTGFSANPSEDENALDEIVNEDSGTASAADDERSKENSAHEDTEGNTL